MVMAAASHTPLRTCRGRWQSASWGNRRVSQAGRSAWRRHAPRGASRRASALSHGPQTTESVCARTSDRVSAPSRDMRGRTARRRECNKNKGTRGHLTARGPAQGDPHTGPQVRVGWWVRVGTLRRERLRQADRSGNSAELWANRPRGGARGAKDDAQCRPGSGARATAMTHRQHHNYDN